MSCRPPIPTPRLDVACIVCSGFVLVKTKVLDEVEYGGCERRSVSFLQIDPASPAEDWPYPNFPPLIPHVPLRLDDSPRRVGYDEFAALFPNMPEKQSAEMVVAVPPTATIGLSFWDVGDWDGVTIVF